MLTRNFPARCSVRYTERCRPRYNQYRPSRNGGGPAAAAEATGTERHRYRPPCAAPLRVALQPGATSCVAAAKRAQRLVPVRVGQAAQSNRKSTSRGYTAAETEMTATPASCLMNAGRRSARSGGQLVNIGAEVSISHSAHSRSVPASARSRWMDACRAPASEPADGACRVSPKRLISVSSSHQGYSTWHARPPARSVQDVRVSGPGARPERWHLYRGLLSGSVAVRRWICAASVLSKGTGRLSMQW